MAARRLRALGCERVVLTLGARGALISDHEGERRIAAPRVKAVDTVGAGDCFTAWLATGIAEGLSLDAAAARAVNAASLCVTRPGAQAAMPRRDELSA
jgi:ribokinase